MRKRFLRIAAVLASLCGAILVSGCVVATSKTVIAPQIQSLFQGTYQVSPEMEKRRPKTVAVLPFFDRSLSRQGSDAVRRGFYNHFSSLPFQDMELYRIDERLQKAGLADPETVHNTPPQKLGEILGADALVYGEISNFDKLFAVVYSQVSVGAEIRMVDAKTGSLLWSGQHVARIHEGGLSVTPVGLVATVIATALNVRDLQLLRACDDLFRDMVKTIPVPSLAEALRPPAITLLVQDGRNLPRKAGEELRVVMQGTPKMRGSFDIGSFRKRIEMQEQEGDPGVYLGIYRVLPGDNLSDALITGRLTDDAGNTAEWVDALGTVTFDTTPPERPGEPRVVGRDGRILLSWDKSTAPDLAGYRLYRSETPLSGYREIARSEFTEHRDGGLENGRRYYYRVSAVDRAGNESEKSASVSGMAVAPGPTAVGGAIEADTTWVAGAGPYVIESEVIVRDRAVLTIEPGTEIRSRGAALTIEGRLMAQGDKERLILFDAAEGVERWRGIRFVYVREKENLLRFVRIRKAAEAVACESSSPRIEESELAENGTAIAIRDAFSQPVVTGNTIQKNEGTAVLVLAGAKPTLSGNRILDNAAEGIVIRSASPAILRNTIIQNRGGGVAVSGAQVSLTENSLFDNGPYDLAGEMSGEPVSALNNWWGTLRGGEVLSRIRGRIDIRSILDAPFPSGKPVALPILDSPLSGSLRSDGFLILSRSPYLVTGDFTLDGGAVLQIEPGVVLQYERNASLIVEDGGIVARGTPERPIVFTASGTSPAAGHYGVAVRFAKRTKLNSVFSHCTVKYATTAFDIFHGEPEISYCHIAGNAQSGVYCRNDAAPRITFSTFEENLGEGGIKSVGMSNPMIRNNNFLGNPVAVQAFSSISIDARHNWWGSSPPDAGLIWGDPEKNIRIAPWLEAPEEKAFPGKR